MDFAGRVVIVTGSASGIGRSAASLFSELGARVVVADVNPDQAREVASALNSACIGVGVDVSDSAQVQAMIDVVIATYGRIDVLCNNAGIGFRGAVTETAEADWDRLFAVNVRGMFLCSKYAMPHLAASETGNIVNTASYTATAAIADRAAYVASKGAITALTRAMAVDHAHQGVRVNAVAPGTIDSPYFERMFAEAPDPAGLRRSFDERAIMGRMGRPEEIARAIAWLASDEASFATGSVLTVDGGSSIWGRN